jgi:glutaredoxin-like YruB-family protein
MAKVIVYTKDDCPWCVKAEEFLRQNKILFEERNAQHNMAFAEEMVRKSGGAAVPVIDVGGTIVTGFNVRKLKEALKLV